MHKIFILLLSLMPIGLLAAAAVIPDIKGGVDSVTPEWQGAVVENVTVNSDLAMLEFTKDLEINDLKIYDQSSDGILYIRVEGELEFAGSPKSPTETKISSDGSGAVWFYATMGDTGVYKALNNTTVKILKNDLSAADFFAQSATQKPTIHNINSNIVIDPSTSIGMKFNNMPNEILHRIIKINKFKGDKFSVMALDYSGDGLINFTKKNQVNFNSARVTEEASAMIKSSRIDLTKYVNVEAINSAHNVKQTESLIILE